MVHTCNGVGIYTADTAGLLLLSAAVISSALSGSTLLMCPVGNQICLVGYT